MVQCDTLIFYGVIPIVYQCTILMWDSSEKVVFGNLEFFGWAQGAWWVVN